jgi:signal transduction histidine kinase
MPGYPPATASVEAERLDAIGGVAAGAAHHLNNIMMVALGNIQIALTHDVGDMTAARLRTAERAVRDAAEVVRSLTSFCRTQPAPSMAPLDLNILLDEVVELTSSRWRDEPLQRGVRIVLQRERAHLPPAIAEPTALREVLLHLVINAIEAMPDGGSLMLRTWADDAGLHCSVSDTGVGMIPEVRRRAFEPFFTTKGPKTLGLGLAVSHGIVTRHRGTLTLDSVKGEGTTAVVSLPLPASPLV